MKCLPLLLLLGICCADAGRAKSYPAPVKVSYQSSGDISALKPGDETETVLHLVSLADLDSVVIYLIPNGVEAATVDQVYMFNDLKTGDQKDVVLKVKLVKQSGSLAVNYTTTTASGTEAGALNICCYGTEAK